MNPRSLLPWALATASGILYFLGFVGFGLWPLAWIALVPLLIGLRQVSTGKRAFLVSWWMGFVTHLGGYWWVILLLRNFAHLPTPAAILGYVLLCAVQGASLAVFGLIAWKLFKRRGWPIGATAPLAMIAAEQVYPLLFQSYLANSQAFVPAVTQIVELGGPLLLSGLIALVNGGLAELIAAALERRRLPLMLPLAAVATLIAALVFGHARIGQLERRDAASPKLKVAIIQANVGAAEKHEHVEEGIARFKAMTEQAMADPTIDLVVWPESGFNRAITKDSNLTGHVAAEVTKPLILGAIRTERDASGQRRIWNSAASIAPGGAVIATFDKIALLAFGEYIPGGQLYPGLYDLLPYTAHFERGESLAPLSLDSWKLSTNICYEDILPGLVRSLMGPIDADGTRPHALVNLTNDSWYGPVEPRIHLALATFRAIEHRRWMIRSTATGLSAFIDSAGRLAQVSEFEKAQTLIHEVPMVTGGPTLYGLIGGIFGWGVAIAVVALAWVVPVVRRPKRA